MRRFELLALVAGLCLSALGDGMSWYDSVWISAADAPVFEGKVLPGSRSAEGTSWFVCARKNEKQIAKATWMTAGLGVYEVYVNGHRVGEHFLKPGYTHYAKTKYAFSYDVTE